MKYGMNAVVTLALAMVGVTIVYSQEPVSKDNRTASGTAWVANGGDANGGGGSVSLIDVEKLKVISTLQIGGYPTDIAFASSHELAYVNDFASDVVNVIDTRTLSVLTTITVAANPGNMVLTPDGEYLYVGSLGSGTISVIKTESNSVIASISVPTQEFLSLAITPNGRFIYATDCCSDNNVSVIDTQTNQLTAQVRLAGAPSGLAITANGRFVFVEDTADVSVIDTATNKVVDTIAGIQGACGPILAMAPDGRRGYVEDYCSNSVYVIDTRSRTLLNTLTLSTPIGAAFSNGGDLLFITSNNCLQFPCTVPSTVSVLNTDDNQVVNTLTVGLNGQNIAISRSTRRNDEESRLDEDAVTRRLLPRSTAPCGKCR